MNTIILILLVILPVGDALATAFFFSLFLRSKRDPPPKPGSSKPSVANRPRLWGGPSLFGGRSWLLGLMTASWAVITLVFILIGYLAGRRLLGLEPFAAGAALTAIALCALCALGLIPIAFAITFYMTRRKRGGPPPFSESD